MKRLSFAILATLVLASHTAAAEGPATVTPSEARAIAKEAYIYGYPIVDSYRIMHTYFANPQSPEYKGTWNEVHNTPRVYTPADKAVQTPNSDTPYSALGLDLRAEPMVLTIPPIEKGRYFSVQFVDSYTHNFDYIGSRTTGNDGGTFLIAGPNWKGEAPKGVDKVMRSETDLVFAIYRTQLFDPGDLDNVKKVQAGYKAQPLSSFLGRPPAAAAPPITFIKPLTPEQQKTSLEVFNILNFVLQFAPTHPSEAELMTRFARIGVGAGRTLDARTLSPELRTALEQGIGDARAEQAALKKRVDAGEVVSGDLFGTREHLKNNYAYRMIGSVLGIFGNSAMEAMYPAYTVDADKQPLDGKRRYFLRFAPGQLPPVNGFFSLTMYELPASLLSANALNRYLINSPMLPLLKKDPDGGVTLLVQNTSPGKENEANWLPAPSGPFFMVMRLYWPKEEAMNGTWVRPALTRIP